MAAWTGPKWLQRTLTVLLILVVVPLILGVSAFLTDTPIRPDERSPRTVIAPDLIRVPDPEATDRARREAAEAVSVVLEDDEDAKAAIVQDVRDVFARARQARQAAEDGQRPSADEQVEALRDRLPMLSEEGLRLLVGLTDDQLDQVAEEAVQVAQQFARQRIREGRVEDIVNEQLPTELVVRPFTEDVAELIVEPVIRGAVRPTVSVDEQATEAAREQAAAEVAEVVRSFPGGSVIVNAGEVVDEVEFAALRQRGLEGSEPWQALLRAFALVVIVAAVVALYLRAYRPQVWASTPKLLLLAVLFTLYAVMLEAVTLLTPDTVTAWLYVLPVGAIAMLATVLFDPPVGILMTIPVTVLAALSVPGEPGVVAFAGAASVLSVPLVSRLSARGDLRRAAWLSVLGYIVLAGGMTIIFSDPERVPIALAAGLLNGVLTAVIVNGSLPFLESVFGVLTATSLLDLADRNHPLLRELEQKALGSYNHSIMVSTMAERAARSIAADSLLVSVAALYHDIGKVRRPYFFVENQFAISNPHDDLDDPRQSAVIIQDHVSDGLEMARSSRLPPEVVEGIATHHGTTLVSYFYRKALEAAGGDESQVDETHFRYKGRKPASKEMAILMLADCCEGASRAAAQNDRNLTRGDLEAIVHGLVTERVEDGQLDESALTFRELAEVQASFIETLVGVYHPRIAYPKKQQGRGEGQLPRPRIAAATRDGADDLEAARSPDPAKIES